MSRKRVALSAIATTLAVAAGSSFSSASAQSLPTADAPGVNYGGTRTGETIWVNVSSTRNLIFLLTIPWEINAARCSDNKGYRSLLWTEVPIAIRPDGAFSSTIVDRFRYRGRRYVETQRVNGTVTAAKVEGTIEGTVRRTRRNGDVIRCTFGPKRWIAID